MMTKKLSAIARFILPLLFWLLFWEISALLIDNKYLLPGIAATFSALSSLAVTASFWKILLFTLIRVISGLALGTVLGCIFAILSHHFSPIKALINPMVSVIKSTPVASFIVVLWILLSGNALSILIAVLMVMPIIYQNILDAYSSVDKELIETAEVFELSLTRKYKVLFIPAMKKFLAPAFITASGLAWKSEIAAEIIGYVKDSVGQVINDAKYNLETPTVFAMTLIIIIFSISLESIAKFFLRRDHAKAN